jgi:hypothetical protein
LRLRSEQGDAAAGFSAPLIAAPWRRAIDIHEGEKVNAGAFRIQ